MLADTLDERIEITERREAVFISLAFVFIVLQAASLSLATAVRFGSWSKIGDRWAHWMVIPIWLLAYLLLRRTLQRSSPTRDPLLLPIPMLFMGLGMLTIWRLDPAFGIRQTGWFILAVCGLYILLNYGKDLRWLRRYRYLWITLGLTLMALTLFFGTHPGGGSPRLWLGCCGFYFQPSEALRFLLVAFLAAYLADRLPFASLSMPGIKAWLPLILTWSLSFSLLIAQRDLGTGMLFMALLTIMLYLVLQRWQVLVGAAALGVVGAWLGYYLFDVVSVRIEAWLNPMADPLGGSYQIIQSLITIASGGIFGRGPGLGSPGFVPAIHTDFIFTAVLEEHGLLAGLALIGLWAVWLSRALKGVVRQRDPFSALINAGLAFSLGVQAAVIIGGNLRVLPLVGVTLPFTSYGGSSLLISVLSVGIILLLSNDGDPSERFGLPLRHLNLGIMVVFGITGVFLGWWVLVRGPDLIARGDNPRPAIDSRFSSRGSIYDRDLQILVETVGSPGGFERVYPEPSMATIVGYDQFPYGQTGLEGSLDGILRGDLQQNGWVTAWSYLTRNLSPPGSDIRLTLDLQSQRIAVDLLSGRRGAVVLMDADTGDLLVAASSPSYDPNTLAQDWSQLINDPASPLINRPFQGQYQPGTVLGPLMIAWELENQRITLDTQVETLDEAVLVNGASLECASLPGAIRQPVFGDVLKYACPAPLQSLMMEGGVPAYEGMIGAFHLTQQADIEPPSEMPPALPQIAEGELAMAAVGQSGLTLTPLQIVRAFTPIITDGTMPLVRWVDALRPSGGEWEQFETPSHPIQVLNGAVSAEIRGELSLGSFVAYQAQAVGGEPIGWFLGGYRGLTGNYAVVVVLEGQASSDAAEIGMVMLENVRVTSIP